MKNSKKSLRETKNSKSSIVLTGEEREYSKLVAQAKLDAFWESNIKDVSH